jgi:hypothetical protein
MGKRQIHPQVKDSVSISDPAFGTRQPHGGGNTMQMICVAKLFSKTQRSRQNLGWLFILVASFAASGAFAQTRSQVYGSSLTKQTMTAYIQDDFAMNTYESEAAGSKEVHGSNTWSIGTYAGEGRDLGICFRSAENTVPFTLNNSYLRANFRDTMMQWRLGWVYPTIAGGLSELKSTSTDSGNFDLYGTSLGAGVGVNVPLFAKAVFYANGMVFETPKAWDKSGQSVTLGQRVEKDIGASIDLTEDIIDFVVGYRTRDYKIRVEQDSYQETTLGAYAGIRLGLYF